MKNSRIFKLKVKILHGIMELQRKEDLLCII